MAQKLIRRGIKYITQIPVENKTTIEKTTIEKTYSKIYPFVIDNKNINTKTSYWISVGQLSIPIEKNKDLSGDLYIQAVIERSKDFYSAMVINFQAILSDGIVNTVIADIDTTLDKTFLSTDYRKLSISASSNTVGINDKLILIIKAKNIGQGLPVDPPNSGKYNTINLIYFEKTS